MEIIKALPIALAGIAELYGDSVDRNGIPKVMHPLEVADYHRDTPGMFLIALLHDVVEDFGDKGRELINQLDSVELPKAIDILSRREGEDYDAYIDRVGNCGNPSVILVKLSDLKVNYERSKKYKNDSLVKRYAKAGKRLTKFMLKLAVKEISDSLEVEDADEDGPSVKEILKRATSAEGIPVVLDDEGEARTLQ